MTPAVRLKTSAARRTAGRRQEPVKPCATTRASSVGPGWWLAEMSTPSMVRSRSCLVPKAGFLRRGPGGHVDEVLHQWRRGEEGADEAAPDSEALRLAEVLRVRLDGVPLDDEDETRRGLDPAGHPDAVAARRAGED